MWCVNTLRALCGTTSNAWDELVYTVCVCVGSQALCVGGGGLLLRKAVVVM